MRLLLTRPSDDAERTAVALRARGHEVVALPLMRVVPVAEPDITPPDGTGWGAVVATSANACRAAANHPAIARLRPLRFFAVGRRTAQAAEDAGFSDVVAATGGVDALAGVVAAQVSDRSRPLLYLAGEDRSGDLAALLAPHGLVVHTVVVYRAVMETDIPAPIRVDLAVGNIHGVLHFSARSAQAFVAALASAGLSPRTMNIQHFCLSAQVAAPLAAAGAANLRIAPRPDERALVDMPGS